MLFEYITNGVYVIKFYVDLRVEIRSIRVRFYYY